MGWKDGANEGVDDLGPGSLQTGPLMNVVGAAREVEGGRDAITVAFESQGVNTANTRSASSIAQLNLASASWAVRLSHIDNSVFMMFSTSWKALDKFSARSSA